MDIAFPRPARGPRVALALGLALALVGCAHGLRTFERRPIVWRDADTRPHPTPPPSFYSSYTWDGADNAVFRPFAEFFTFETDRESWNVNAMDEVPDSSWFQNRLGVRTMTPEEVGQGACAEDWAIPAPWRIVGGKPDGANPGFQIEDGNGVRYLLKTEGLYQPYRPAAADTVGAMIFHAAGYYVPCNRVVHFERDVFILDSEATIERTNGSVEPLEDHHVEEVLAQATRLPDGGYRASVSQFIQGRPISPWRYHGLRDGDPNDVVPHEHRRDVRAMYVLSAWTDHIDARQENTLLAWLRTEEDGAGHVRHYMIDFGDCFGILHPWDNLARRFGHSGYLDTGDIVTDLFTFGAIDRPWYHARLSDAGRVLGYYDVVRFQPDAWRPGYANNAYDRVTELDKTWMARIIARFRDEHIRAMVERARFPDPVVTAELDRILRGRRDRILERWLTHLSPLTWARVEPSPTGSGARVCLQDLALWTGIRDADTRTYRAAAYAGDDQAPLPVEAPVPADESYVCVDLPEPPGAMPEAPAYLIVDVIAATEDRETTGPARLHFYSLGPAGAELVGLERPASAAPPRR
ncbi:MAG: hypothetical protein ACFCGT_25610 [Sandaracinaceae bacterium]